MNDISLVIDAGVQLMYDISLGIDEGGKVIEYMQTFELAV